MKVGRKDVPLTQSFSCAIVLYQSVDETCLYLVCQCVIYTEYCIDILRVVIKTLFLLGTKLDHSNVYVTNGKYTAAILSHLWHLKETLESFTHAYSLVY